ncbi:MAG: response regulator [Candidatus Omnitrophota bacterium]|jgi:DNA-binding response OmpR family regulator
MGGALERAKILIIDKADDTREAMAYIFEKKGFLVATARSGKEALAMVPQENPDIIIFNIIFSEIDAFETGRHLRENAATRDIPIIFLSAGKDLRGLIYRLPRKKVKYMEKPCKIMALIKQVNKMVALSGHSPPATA